MYCCVCFPTSFIAVYNKFDFTHSKMKHLIFSIIDRLYFLTLIDRDFRALQLFEDWKSSNGSDVFYVCLQKHLPFGELYEEFDKFHLGLMYHFVNIVKTGLKVSTMEKLVFSYYKLTC